MKFPVPNYSCFQNPWLGGYCPQIPVLSVLCPQLKLLNPPPKKIPGYATDWYTGAVLLTQWLKLTGRAWVWNQGIHHFFFFFLQRFLLLFHCMAKLVILVPSCLCQCGVRSYLPKHVTVESQNPSTSLCSLLQTSAIIECHYAAYSLQVLHNLCNHLQSAPLCIPWLQKHLCPILSTLCGTTFCVSCLYDFV